MDWPIVSTSVVILGAGFSAAATDGKLPLMTGYFDRLRREEFSELHDFVKEVGCNKRCERIESADVERVLLALDQIRTSPEALLKDWLGRWKPNVPLIQRQMSYYTLARLRDGSTVAPDNWAAKLLAACGPGTTVISMNYDVIAEQILSNRPGMTHRRFTRSPTCPHCKMGLLLERACSCGLKDDNLGDDWRGAIVKLHGSISWRQCMNTNCCSYECFVADEQCRPFTPCDCPNCGTACAPVLVMPTMSKNLDEMRELKTMWQAARLALLEAESILLFGFRMPDSDELLRQLIRSACGESRRLKRVASIDLQPEPILDRFDSNLPAGLNVEVCAFPVKKGEVPIWFDLAASSILVRSSS